MLFLISLLFLSMFIYVNSLYYTIVLLAIIFSLLYSLVSSLMLNVLTFIMIAIVYVGAIIILIGYICAICPNLILSASNIPFSFSFSFSFILFIVLSFYITPFSSCVLSPVVSYFYTTSGIFIFLLLVFILFITLLIVTSQYLTPKGPFRSLSL